MLFSCHSNNNISNISQIASCLAVSLIYVQFLSVSYSHSRLSLFLLPCCPSVALQALPVSFHWNPSPPPLHPHPSTRRSRVLIASRGRKSATSATDLQSAGQDTAWLVPCIGEPRRDVQLGATQIKHFYGRSIYGFTLAGDL